MQDSSHVAHPPFTALAEVYDHIMRDVDYQAWADFVRAESEARGLPSSRALDLGCGTGNFTIPLARRGFDPVGLDASPAMLAVARRKEPSFDWRLGEFTSFELGERFGLVVSVFDSLNNLVTAEQFLAMARRVRAHLLPTGVFLFDVNTTVGLRDLWEGGLMEGWAGEVHYRWTHSFDPDTGLAKVEADWERGGRRFSEVHFERPYDAAEVEALLGAAGFAEIGTVDFETGDPAEEDAERIWVSARAVTSVL